MYKFSEVKIYLVLSVTAKFLNLLLNLNSFFDIFPKVLLSVFPVSCSHTYRNRLQLFYSLVRGKLANSYIFNDGQESIPPLPCHPTISAI